MYKIVEECILKLDYLKYSITDNSINKRWIVDRFSRGRFSFSFKKDQQRHDFNFTIFNYFRQLSFFFSPSFYYHLYPFIFLGVKPIINSGFYAQRKHYLKIAISLELFVVFSFFILCNYILFFPFFEAFHWNILAILNPLFLKSLYSEASIFKLLHICDSFKKKKINSIGDYSKHVSPLSLLM